MNYAREVKMKTSLVSMAQVIKKIKTLELGEDIMVLVVAAPLALAVE